MTQIEATLSAVEKKAERFQVERVEADTLTLIVRDTLTSRVREATHEPLDAIAVAAWLNGGHQYVGGEPTLRPAA
jgi:hypothetical protein